MGLISGLLTLPLAPVRGTIAVAEQVLAQAEEQYYDPATIRRQLDEVQRARDAGALTEDEATELEDALVDRLLASRERTRTEKGRHR